MLTQAVGVSLHSLSVLLDKSFMGARDAFGISRSVCEAAVNAAHLLSEPDAAARATAYSIQRFYRDTRREVSLAGYTLSVSPAYEVDLAGIEGLEQALAAYTRPSGTEIREWSGRSLDEKIEQLTLRDSAAGRSFALSRLLIYGISSEVLHGSPYGVMYFWTALGDLPGNSADASRKMMIHYLTSILASALALDGLILSWVGARSTVKVGWQSAWIIELLERLVKLQIAEEKAGDHP